MIFPWSIVIELKVYLKSIRTGSHQDAVLVRCVPSAFLWCPCDLHAVANVLLMHLNVNKVCLQAPNQMVLQTWCTLFFQSSAMTTFTTVQCNFSIQINMLPKRTKQICTGIAQCEPDLSNYLQYIIHREAHFLKGLGMFMQKRLKIHIGYPK